MIEATLRAVESGHALSMDEMSQTLDLIMQGMGSEDQIARLLVALHRRGETVDEVAGAATAMRRHMTPIRTCREGLIDTCGTGGDGARTFNISTAAAIVAAAAGVPVAKHGNRRITSRSGSADVLIALGVNVEASVACVEACLDELGLAFCFAPLLHRAMRHVAPVRNKLGTPTIFNILGPLVNPAGAEYQLLGVGHGALQPLLAEALLMLGTRRVLVVHGADGLDEVTMSGATYVTEAVKGQLKQCVWHPRDFGLETSTRDALLVDGPEQSAAIIRALLRGQPGPPRDIVIANAAAALWTVGRGDSLTACAQQAATAIDSGAAAGLLARLAEYSHRH
jgi:anthranilate phosphoribosyltransferase